MQTFAHGIDLVDIARFERTLTDHPERFRERCFTENERAYALAHPRRESQHLAARFAAKEATLKAIGTGWRDGIAWTDIEVRLLPSGAPTLHVGGKAGEIAAQLGITGWLVSLSHTDTHAIASVIALGQSPTSPPPSP
ncbi:MAG: holo-ACP synthase [Phycisphaeraceae bacterium]|nr:holo-ACP synthase [Phycisphaeraceae bacterium]MCB9848002.1 holo-ACP synthase [Phycisphaeraceae bacterium]